MNSPQLENGFTRIANEILEGLATTNLNGTQRRILDVVFRQTYGYQRKSHELSLTFIGKATNLNKKQIQRELNKLIERRVLKVIREATFNGSRVLEFNKNIEGWLISGEVADKTPPLELDTHTGIGLDPSTGSGLDPQRKKERKLKERNQYDDFVKILLPLYPGRKSKSVRDKKLPKILKEHGEDKIIACVENYAKTVKGTEKQFILNESTFWNTRYIDFLDCNQDEFDKQDRNKSSIQGLIDYESPLGRG